MSRMFSACEFVHITQVSKEEGEEGNKSIGKQANLSGGENQVGNTKVVTKWKHIEVCIVNAGYQI